MRRRAYWRRASGELGRWRCKYKQARAKREFKRAAAEEEEAEEENQSMIIRKSASLAVSDVQERKVTEIADLSILTILELNTKQLNEAIRQF